MTTFNMNFGSSGTSRTQNVTANNDTINVSADGFKAGTTWQTSTTNCSVSPSSGSIPSGQGNVSLTVSNFPRSTSNGSYSFTITGNNGNRTCTGSGTIGASTGTISIGGGSSLAAGTTVTVSWTSNDSSAKGWNSTTGRFSPGSGSSTLTGTSGSFNVTCQDPAGNVPDGVWENNSATLRLAGLGSSVIATSNSVLIHTQANAGTAGLTLTTDTQSNGTFIITGSTTATSPGTINYRFIDGPNTSGTILQAFSTSNTYSGTGSQRGSPITLQVREQIQTNNTGTVYSQDFSSATITVPYVNPQTNVTLPTNKNILWDASSFSLTIGNGNILDEYKVVLTSNTSVVLKDWTTKNTASGSDFTFTVSNNINTTYFPNQSLSDPGVSCTVFVRRSTTNGGNGSATSVGTFTVKRRYREGPFGSVAVSTPAFADRTIGAQEFIAYGGTQQDVRITGSGVISGATYKCRINSGTTSGGGTSPAQVYSQVASGTEPNAQTTGGGLTVSQLPAASFTVEYIVKCIVPTNLGGDGTTEHDCTTLTIPVPGSTLTFDMTRSGYVQPDGTIDITSSATLVSGSDYRIGASSTSETVSYTNGSAVTEYRLSKMVGSQPTGGTVDTASGASGIFTVGSTDLPPNAGDEQGYTVEFRVPETSDGTGQWLSNLQTNSLLFQREQLIQPTLGTLQAYANSSGLAQIVPTVERTNNSGNGLIEYAWSSTNSTPTNWTSLGALGYVAGFDVAAGGISRSATNLYMGMREKSPIDGTTTAATYVSNTSGPFYNEVDTYKNRFIIMTYDGVDYEPSLGEQVIIDATELTKNVTVKGSLSSLAKTAYTETQVTPGTAGFSITSSVTSYSSFSLRTDAAATLNGVSRSANYLVGQDTANSSGNAVLTIANPDEIVDAGNSLGYTLYEYVFTGRGGRGTEVATTPTIDNNMVIRRRGVTDDTITVTGLRQTLANNHSTNLVLTVADGSSGTEYQLYSQGSEYDTVVGNGTLTATNPGELPTAGNTRSYNVRWREAGTSDAYQNATGTGTSFTVGRLNSMNLGALSNPVSIEAPVNSATITLDGAVGNITALLTKNSGGGTVRLSKNNQSYANSTASGTSITVVDGDTLAVRAESPSTYSNTTTCTLTLTQDSVTIFSDTFSFTTEASPGGSTGGGGGTGNYGLEIRDSSNNIILTNSDRVGDFCYATPVTVASGASTGVSTTQAVGGNVVIIEENLNPTNEDDRVYATLENNGKQVRINMLGVTASTTLTFNVLVFNI